MVLAKLREFRERYGVASNDAMPILSQAPQECGEGAETRLYCPTMQDVQESCTMGYENPRARSKQMKTCRKCQEPKQLDEFYRDKKSSDGKHSYCKECERARRRKYHYDNHEKSTATSRKWKANNKERNKEITQSWRESNELHIVESTRAYREANRDKVNEWNREWRRKNPLRKARNDRRRRECLITATPPWVSDADLAPFYELSHRMTEETGIKHEVDHIVPIVNDAVSGLNVPCNLQVITRSENARKSNTFKVA